MLDVEVQLASACEDLPAEAQLASWAQAAWREAQCDASVVIRVCDVAESQALNHEFRGKDKPTNVLSFPYDALPGMDLYHAGDLLICAPVVAEEAAQQRKSMPAHWAHMVVHGMLHLQGYDHEVDTHAVEMEALETDIVTALGFPAPFEGDY